MKKNPIDELFAQKLAEHLQEPSQRALEHFKERLKEKENKKRGVFFTTNRNVWYYGAAASIAIALSVGLLLQNKQPKGDLVEKQAKSKVIEQKSDKIESQIALVLPKNTNKIEFKNRKKSTQLNNNLVPKQLFETPIEVAKKNENLSPIAVPNELLKEEKVAVNIEKAEQILPKIDELPSKKVEQKSDKTDLVLVISDLPISQKQDVVFEKNDTSEANNDFLEEKNNENKAPDEPFLKRFWTQLKHLKNGEKVDLKVLKIKPKEVLARANDALFKEDRQDAQESWGRLKNRLSKNNN